MTSLGARRFIRLYPRCAIKIKWKIHLPIIDKIKIDLKECQIERKVILAFVPIAFATFLIHELGHWTFGEMAGNDMTISLNNTAPKNGVFIENSDALWSAIGGPVFTILQAVLCLLLTWATKSIYAYSMAFFAVFSRWFAIVFGGIDFQDEARIAAMLDWNKYLIVAMVLTILCLILWRCNQIMKLSKKGTGYFTVLGVFAILIVIGVNKLMVTR